MKSITTLAAAVALAASVSYAQDTVVTQKTTTSDPAVKSTTIQSSTAAPATTVKSETTQQSSTSSSPGSVTKTSSSSTVTNSYTTRLESAYRAAGVVDADIVRLRDIDLQVMEARRANNLDKVKEYYTQQTSILKPEQVTKVRTYLTEHPVAVTEPKYYVSSYETVPATAGVSITTPMGGASIGVPAGGTVVEKKEVVPANP
ncbi:MAG: hypothetical protein ACR2IE_02275 [Candidatus Sumerlaeaceae bacterium]